MFNYLLSKGANPEYTHRREEQLFFNLLQATNDQTSSLIQEI